ncbi:MAG: glycosyltransferase, partial [Planctomycetes bacterium]|nr:glycosyltransferase [Planctomycetota bacterium]
MTAPEQASLSVLLCGAWDDGDGYPRTAALRQGLERAGHEVRECRVPGLGRSKHRLLRQPWRWPAALLRAARDRRRLLAALRRAQAERRPDCIVVPYPGHRLVAAVKANAAAPVVLDLFLSAYDTVVEDRRLCEPGSLGAWWLQRLDRAACAAADLVLVDTPCNAAYVAALTGLPPERFAWLPLSDPHAAAPVPHAPVAEVGDGGALRVLFFGTGVPLHGLDVLIDACVDGPVHLTLVGGTAADRGHARAALGDRVTLAPEFVDRHRLAELLAQCDLVAG